MLEIDDAGGLPAPLAQLRNEVGAAGEHAGIAALQGGNGGLDCLGTLIDEFLQRSAPSRLHLNRT
jgi:hypothetical protein